MWEIIQNFIISNFNDAIKLLDISQEDIEKIWINTWKVIFVLVIWSILSKLIYSYIIRIFKKYNLKQKIDKFEDFLESEEDIKKGVDPEKIKKKLTDRIKLDVVIAKSVSYYIFLFFFKQSLYVSGIKEAKKIEESLDKLLDYLPSLFIWIVIWFFGIRFANFIYDITYHTLSIAESNSKTKTSKIIATGSKWLILFLTFTMVLNFTQLIDKDTLNIILIGFISMLALAWGLAFWLWWRDMAKDILNKFNKED